MQLQIQFGAPFEYCPGYHSIAEAAKTFTFKIFVILIQQTAVSGWGSLDVH